jgi:hypothetical protein
VPEKIKNVTPSAEVHEGDGGRIIVEVGCRSTPFFIGQGKRKLGPNDTYIGVDLFPRGEKEGLQSILDFFTSRDGGRHQARCYDARRLPFGNKKVDEVIFVNVLSDASARNSIGAFIAEAARVTKYMGQITVADTYAPEMVPPKRIRGYMARHGLVQVNSDAQHDPSTVGLYARGKDPRSYAAIFRFTQQPPSFEPFAPPSSNRIIAAGSLLGNVCAQVTAEIGTLNESVAAMQAASEKLALARADLAVALAAATNLIHPDSALNQALEHVGNSGACVRTAQELLGGWVAER